ncbi:MAG: asparagine synthetase B [Alphaproteobacteria bacterium]|nr:asparagine synthetase B [Alphaproteobacteria bacterium]
MSAIAGIWHFGEGLDVSGLCARMLASQQIYGPHGQRIAAYGNVAMGIRLFASLPEDLPLRQPLQDREGRFAVVADIRLDNRPELARDLGLEVGRGRSLCDAEYLLEAWRRWGDDCLDRLVGDYAFAIWDREKHRLTLARDPFGTRPIHYHQAKDFVAFATMPKGLHALPEVPYAVDEEQVFGQLAFLPEHGSRTFFKHIERVEPGCLTTFERQRTSSRRHWNPQSTPAAFANDQEVVEAARSLLDDAVRARLRSAAGPIGSHLSAGLDSGGVTATAARLLAPRGDRLIAFTSVPREGYDSAVPRGRIADEGDLAAKTAALYSNIEHVTVRTGNQSPLDGLDRDFFLFERPIVNICNQMWLSAVSAAARDRGVRVMLTAITGNAILSYDGFSLLPDLIGEGRWMRWLAEAQALTSSGRQKWRGILAQSFGPWIPSPVWTLLVRVYQGRTLKLDHASAINMQRYQELDLYRQQKERGWDMALRPRRDSFQSRLWALRRVDFGNYNKGILGGWQIEQRDVMTDRRLAEFCLSLPSEAYLAKGTSRLLARRVLADRVPGEVLDERRRGLQTADWHERIVGAKSDILAEIERLERCVPAARSIDINRLRQLAEHMPLGGWDQPDIELAYRFALLRGISNGHFLRKAAGGNA